MFGLLWPSYGFHEVFRQRTNFPARAKFLNTMALEGVMGIGSSKFEISLSGGGILFCIDF